MSLRMFFIGAPPIFLLRINTKRPSVGWRLMAWAGPFASLTEASCMRGKKGDCLLATHKLSSHDFTVSLRLRRISTQMTGVE